LDEVKLPIWLETPKLTASAPSVVNMGRATDSGAMEIHLRPEPDRVIDDHVAAYLQSLYVDPVCAMIHEQSHPAIYAVSSEVRSVLHEDVVTIATVEVQVAGDHCIGETNHIVAVASIQAGKHTDPYAVADNGASIIKLDIGHRRRRRLDAQAVVSGSQCHLEAGVQQQIRDDDSVMAGPHIGDDCSSDTRDCDRVKRAIDRGLAAGSCIPATRHNDLTSNSAVTNYDVIGQIVASYDKATHAVHGGEHIARKNLPSFKSFDMQAASRAQGLAHGVPFRMEKVATRNGLAPLAAPRMRTLQTKCPNPAVDAKRTNRNVHRKGDNISFAPLGSAGLSRCRDGISELLELVLPDKEVPCGC
jgi:hypothetical protein